MLATMHASSAEDAAYRLAILAMRGNGNLQVDAVLQEVQRCLDVDVYVTREQGLRHVDTIYCCKGVEHQRAINR